MKKWVTIAITFFSLLFITMSCAQEICPGNGSYSYVPPRKITHKSTRMKVRESLIHSHKPAGRKPPKKHY